VLPKLVSIGTVEVGDVLRYWQFNLEDSSKAFDSQMRETRLIRKLGGYMVFKDAPVPGASGSCIVNSKGLVVGIVVWGMKMKDESYVGLGVVIPQE